MGKNKLARFEDNQSAPNILQEGKALFDNLKGNWKELYFKNSNPITLELACGKGEYTVGLAAHFADRNFVGVDVKGARMWRGSQTAIENNWQHVAFLRTRIHALESFFAPQEIDDIWIVFPDPRPRLGDEKRRLTSPRFLKMYRNIAKPDAWIRLKTDNAALYAYTLEVLEKENIRNLTHTADLYNSPLLEEHFGIKTYYEEFFTAKGSNVHYIKFQFA